MTIKPDSKTRNRRSKKERVTESGLQCQTAKADLPGSQAAETSKKEGKNKMKKKSKKVNRKTVSQNTQRMVAKKSDEGKKHSRKKQRMSGQGTDTPGETKDQKDVKIDIFTGLLNVFSEFFCYDDDPSHIRKLRRVIEEWPAPYTASLAACLAAIYGYDSFEPLVKPLFNIPEEDLKHIAIQSLDAAEAEVQEGITRRSQLLEDISAWCEKVKDSWRKGDLPDQQRTLLQSFPGWEWYIRRDELMETLARFFEPEDPLRIHSVDT